MTHHVEYTSKFDWPKFLDTDQRLMLELREMIVELMNIQQPDIIDPKQFLILFWYNLMTFLIFFEENLKETIFALLIHNINKESMPH